MAEPFSSTGTPSESRLIIIHAGFFRTATKSMALAYQILGFTTHHGLLEDILQTPWNSIEQAAEATWPSINTPPGRTPRPPFARADWDALWGAKYQVVTDLASPFARELIKAYPEAKIVVVQRDVEQWWPSFKSEVLDPVFAEPRAAILTFIGRHFLGQSAIQAVQRIVFGFFGTKTRAELTFERAKEKYDAYYAEVRMLAAGRMLEYRMGDGWEPLCAFLGVDVPDVPFPRVNDRASHKKDEAARIRKALAGLLPWNWSK
ncbi:Efflux pump antibiotic resistance protein [Mycena sanguinolenta]|uniref:Efflux pump antibiotic resistance protein n=1 Tax=Mycena sanguinolenta TaxID=230812 RepID=A0A8H6ZH69_9AGAR|nr:Efflux pump antibiotic resistance protein [Mycena sanguinolenta]